MPVEIWITEINFRKSTRKLSALNRLVSPVHVFDRIDDSWISFKWLVIRVYSFKCDRQFWQVKDPSTSTDWYGIDSIYLRTEVYTIVWDNPIVSEELVCECELGNSHDPYAVAVKKANGGEMKVVGHVPRSISAICSLLFIRRGGMIRCSKSRAIFITQLTKFWRVKPWRIDVLLAKFAKVLHRQRFPLYGINYFL